MPEDRKNVNRKANRKIPAPPMKMTFRVVSMLIQYVSSRNSSAKLANPTNSMSAVSASRVSDLYFLDSEVHTVAHNGIQLNYDNTDILIRGNHIHHCGLVYPSAVGINVALKPEEKNFYMDRLVANETDMGNWAIGGGSEVYSRQNEPIRWRPPWHWNTTPLGGPSWRQWLDSDGEEGLEPPEIIKELWDLTVEWLAEPNGTERYMELGKQIFQINAAGSFNVYQAAADAGIKRVVSASSINALGFNFGVKASRIRYLPIDEDHPNVTTDAYSFCKEVLDRF